ncbi:MAG: hypothetical protein KAU20_06880 [Nanoarchaeota archaeon]|nr:hypothetical protein [Nanoarchaeota archaeon]
MRNILDIIWEQVHIYGTTYGKKPETLLIHPLTYKQLELCAKESSQVIIDKGNTLGTCFGLRILRSEDLKSSETIVF